ncbi:hypothetical protein FHS59_003440 [Algoriphagus iocasae]|uniref:Uncharacterized protein n=1 Tax=Algoriphagus iocasae TaxID=1836499 RepID=A0A841MQJ4_9BACT|nr:hypothetical protein [Algoriphagus iocasae]MBB6327797.1 hypothetical protein [Algoriphagus iocasae]
MKGIYPQPLKGSMGLLVTGYYEMYKVPSTKYKVFGMWYWVLGTFNCPLTTVH